MTASCARFALFGSGIWIEKLRERLAKLAGGVAVIRVGAPSESEMKAKKEALDDAISSTKALVSEGIVPGELPERRREVTTEPEMAM
jgi:hypothetical protein